MADDRAPGAAEESAPDSDGCPVCGAPTLPRPGGTQLVAGETVAREIGSCLGCGLQLVRPAGERWREIRG